MVVEELGGRQEPDGPPAGIGDQCDADRVEHAHVVDGQDGGSSRGDAFDPGDPDVQREEVRGPEDATKHPPTEVELWHARDSKGM